VRAVLAYAGSNAVHGRCRVAMVGEIRNRTTKLKPTKNKKESIYPHPAYRYVWLIIALCVRFGTKLMEPSSDVSTVAMLVPSRIFVILPIDRQISLFLFYFSLRVLIWKQLFRIMHCNNRTKISYQQLSC